jgi:hypothetical protein
MLLAVQDDMQPRDGAKRPATVPRREIATWQGFAGWMHLQLSTLAFFFFFFPLQASRFLQCICFFFAAWEARHLGRSHPL